MNKSNIFNLKEQYNNLEDKLTNAWKDHRRADKNLQRFMQKCKEAENVLYMSLNKVSGIEGELASLDKIILSGGF